MLQFSIKSKSKTIIFLKISFFIVDMKRDFDIQYIKKLVLINSTNRKSTFPMVFRTILFYGNYKLAVILRRKTEELHLNKICTL